MPPEIRTPRARTRPLLLAVLLLVAALVFAACGSEDDESAASDASPAAIAPADAPMYFEVLLQPDGDVADGVVTAIRRVSLLDDPIGDLRRSLEEEVDSDRVSFSRDIEPWLGDRAGVFVLPAPNDPDFEDPDVGVGIAVRDEGAAEDLLAKMREEGDTRDASYEGVDYVIDADASSGEDTVAALLDGTVFFGTLPAFRAAVDASRGDALDSSQAYEEALDRVADDALLFAYIDFEPILPALTESADVDMADPSVARAFEQLRDAGPVTMSLTARADEIAIEVAGSEESIPDTEDAGGAVSIDDLPGDAWAALAVPPLGPAIRQALEQAGQYDVVAQQVRAAAGLDLERDVLGWLGGLAAFVRGTAPLELGGGIVIGSADAAASERLVGRLEQMVGALGVPARPVGGETGFEISVPDLPQPIVVIAKGDKVAIGLGGPSTRDALDPRESFADSENGKAVLDTLGDGYEPSFALVLGPMLQLVRAVGADSDPDFQQALPYLSAYRSIASGTKREDGDVTVRIVAGLQDPTP